MSGTTRNDKGVAVLIMQHASPLLFFEGGEVRHQVQRGNNYTERFYIYFYPCLRRVKEFLDGELSLVEFIENTRKKKFTGDTESNEFIGKYHIEDDRVIPYTIVRRKQILNLWK